MWNANYIILYMTIVYNNYHGRNTIIIVDVTVLCMIVCYVLILTRK